MAAIEFFSTSLMTDPNLEGYYRAENVNDASGNSRTLTNNGSVAFAAMKFNNGFDLGDNNSSKYLSIASTFDLNTSNTGSHSICVWINLYSGFGTEHISHSIINGGRDIAFRVVGGYIGVEVYDGSTTQTVTDNTTALTAGTTYHVGYKFVLNAVTLYVNGLPVFTGSVTNNGTVGTTAFAFGRHATVATAYLEGKLDDPVIFSRALTDAEFLGIGTGVFPSSSGMFLMF